MTMNYAVELTDGERKAMPDLITTCTLTHADLLLKADSEHFSRRFARELKRFWLHQRWRKGFMDIGPAQLIEQHPMHSLPNTGCRPVAHTTLMVEPPIAAVTWLYAMN